MQETQTAQPEKINVYLRTQHDSACVQIVLRLLSLGAMRAVQSSAQTKVRDANE